MSFTYLCCEARFRLKRDTLKNFAAPRTAYVVNRLVPNDDQYVSSNRLLGLMNPASGIFPKDSGERERARLIKTASPIFPAKRRLLRIPRPLLAPKRYPADSLGHIMYLGKRAFLPNYQRPGSLITFPKGIIRPRIAFTYNQLPFRKSRLARDVSGLNQDSGESSELNMRDESENSSEESMDDSTSGSLEKSGLRSNAMLPIYQQPEWNPFDMMKNIENKDFSTNHGGMNQEAEDSSTGSADVHIPDTIQGGPASYQRVFAGPSSKSNDAEPLHSKRPKEDDNSDEDVLSRGLSDQKPALLNEYFPAKGIPHDQTADKSKTLEGQIYRKFDLDDATSKNGIYTNGEQATSFNDGMQEMVNALGEQSALRGSGRGGNDRRDAAWPDVDVFDWKLRPTIGQKSKNIDRSDHSSELTNGKKSNGPIETGSQNNYPPGPSGGQNTYPSGGQYLTNINMFTGLSLNDFNEEKSQGMYGTADKMMTSPWDQNGKDSALVNIASRDLETGNKETANRDSNLRKRYMLAELPYFKTLGFKATANGNFNENQLAKTSDFSNGKNLDVSGKQMLGDPIMYNQRVSEFTGLTNGRSMAHPDSKTLGKTAGKNDLAFDKYIWDYQLREPEMGEITVLNNIQNARFDQGNSQPRPDNAAQGLQGMPNLNRILVTESPSLNSYLPPSGYGNPVNARQIFLPQSFLRRFSQNGFIRGSADMNYVDKVLLESVGKTGVPTAVQYGRNRNLPESLIRLQTSSGALHCGHKKSDGGYKLKNDMNSDHDRK